MHLKLPQLVVCTHIDLYGKLHSSSFLRWGVSWLIRHSWSFSALSHFWEDVLHRVKRNQLFVQLGVILVSLVRHVLKDSQPRFLRFLCNAGPLIGPITRRRVVEDTQLLVRGQLVIAALLHHISRIRHETLANGWTLILIELLTAWAIKGLLTCKHEVQRTHLASNFRNTAADRCLIAQR